MDVFDLVAKIRLDSSEYEQGVGKEKGLSSQGEVWARKWFYPFDLWFVACVGTEMSLTPCENV